MPPPNLLDPSTLDCSKVLYDREAIYKALPQKYEMAQLDGVIYADREQSMIAAYRDVRADEWWCRGHMPGNPIFPGVLMMESAAQCAAFTQNLFYPVDNAFMGFGGVDEAKFRDSVIPPARVVLICRMVEARSRRFICRIQAYVAKSMVFEGLIAGIQLKM